MDERIRVELEKEEVSDFHKALLSHCRHLVDMSRRHMSTKYAAWDIHNETYRGERTPDKKDEKAKERGEPQKMVVPITFAQVQTFIAFCFSLFYQRDRLFFLTGMGEEDHAPAKVGEALLQRDLNYNVFESRLYQFLLDVSRFGLGVIKTGWVHEKQKVKEFVTQAGVSVVGELVGQGRLVEVETLKTKFLGNKIVNVSPYRFFPDVRIPLSRLQEGEFVGSEDEISYISLKRMEKDGQIAGVAHIKAMSRQDIDARGSSRLFQATILDTVTAGSGVPQSKGVHVLTECQVTLVPKDFMVTEGEPLGPEDYPVKYNVWYVNDKRVVKAEPLGYVHNQYTYDVAEFSPDIHNLVNDGLAGTIDQLQSVISWFINSHITSVRKTIENRLVVDPQGVEMKDLVERRPVIRLKPGVSQTGVDRWIKQLETRDVTQGHVVDAQVLQQLIQVVTGINENALGQFHQGRRSATEARNVNSATAARLKMIAQLVFRNGLEPMAKKMLSNLRDGLDEETFVHVMGDMADPNTMISFKKVTKADLVGEYDFEVFDSTMPSERHFQAQSLEELVTVLFQNPQAIPLLGYDPRLIVREILELRNVRNPERFLLTPVRLQLLQQQLMQYEQIRGPGQAGSEGASTGASGQPRVSVVG